MLHITQKYKNGLIIRHSSDTVSASIIYPDQGGHTMSSNWKRYAIGVMLTCLSLLSASCGSGSGKSTPPTDTVSGTAVKGPIANAMVSAYKMDALGNQGTEVLDSTTTAADGSYALRIPKGTGPIMIVVRGTATSSYVNEADPTGPRVAFTAGETLRAAVIDPATVNNVPVTPFTDMAVTLLQQYAATAPAGTSLVTLNTAAINAIETAVRTMTGASSFSISDVSTPSSTAALALFAQMLTTQSAGDPAITSTSLAQSFVNAIFSGGNNLTQLNSDIAAAATVLQNNPAVTTNIPTPTAIPVVVAPDFTDVTPPTVPTNLNRSVSHNEVILTWTASTNGVAGYFVSRNGIRIATVTAPGYTDATVAASTTYTYSVEAFDANGNISAPATLSVTTPAAPLPGSLDIIVGGQIR